MDSAKAISFIIGCPVACWTRRDKKCTSFLPPRSHFCPNDAVVVSLPKFVSRVRCVLHRSSSFLSRAFAYHRSALSEFPFTWKILRDYRSKIDSRHCCSTCFFVNIYEFFPDIVPYSVTNLLAMLRENRRRPSTGSMCNRECRYR